MIAEAREFFRTGKGKNVAIGLVIVALGVCGWSIASNFGDDEATAFSKARVFICAETKKAYDYELTIGSKIPAPSPHSDKDTGYPAELCFWTKDGKVKEEPTAVLLNIYTGSSEPTYCPDCDRLVVPRNPAPEQGSRPPRSRSETNATK